jgi:ABC-type multidrug transport system ATPase subunit
MIGGWRCVAELTGWRTPAAVAIQELQDTQMTMECTTDTMAIAVRRLCKRYGRVVAVDDASFVVPRGSVCGFVGPNGSRKTTIRMLLGLVRPSSGVGAVLGSPLRAPAHYLPRVGALIESPRSTWSV